MPPADFGVQDGGSGCFCGDSLDLAQKYGKSTNCTMACGSDPEKPSRAGELSACGGPGCNSIYKVSYA